MSLEQLDLDQPGLDRITLDQLALDLDGRLSRPGDPDWDTSRQAWNLAVDQRPAAVATVASTRDVQTVVRAAVDLGFRIAPQSTGHNAGPLGRLDDTILLRLSGMRQVSVDLDRRLARVEGGAVWGDVTPIAAKHGLAALAGSAADVGVAGYTLGGGVSWLARSHGLSASHVVALDVVTADGRLRRVDAEHDPDLFWALRGGGGSFGVVTALELELFPLTQVYAGTLFFPLARAAEVLHTWREWTATVPTEVMSIGRLLRFPPLPELPPFLSGQSYAVVEICSTLPVAETDELLAPLRALGPAIDSIVPTPVELLDRLHMDPDGPAPCAGDGWLLRTFTDEAVESLLAVAGPEVDSPLLSVELRHLGGALAPGRGGGALDGIDAAYLGFAVGITPTPEAVSAVHAAVSAVQQAVAPWSTDRCYLNFAERQKAPESVFGATTYARLRDVKAAYDPADLFRSNHPVTPV